jgi:hypothetical protein
MIPLGDPNVETGHQDDLNKIGTALPPVTPTWNLPAFRAQVPGDHFEAMPTGRSWQVAAADVVSNAPELARLTLNIATVHHDAGGGRRLVYGGHTMGIALAQLTRAIPNIVTIVSWESCDHTAPVHEGDQLTSEIVVTGRNPLPEGGLVHLRVTVHGPDGQVLDWRLTALLA